MRRNKKRDINAECEDLFNQAINSFEEKNNNDFDVEEYVGEHDVEQFNYGQSVITIKGTFEECYVYNSKSECIYLIKWGLLSNGYCISNIQGYEVAKIECDSESSAGVFYKGKRLNVYVDFSLKGFYYRISGEDWKIYGNLTGTNHRYISGKSQIAECHKAFMGKDYITIKHVEEIDVEILLISLFAIESINHYRKVNSNNNYSSKGTKNIDKACKRQMKEMKSKDKKWKEWLKDDKYYHEVDWDWNNEDND